jgi:hypothetical protein
MELLLRTTAFQHPIRAGDSPVTAQQIRAELARQLGLDPEAEIVLPSTGVPVAVEVTLTDNRSPYVTLTVTDDGPDDFAQFERCMAALRHARRSLALAAEQANPDWWDGIPHSTGHHRKATVGPIEALVGDEGKLDSNSAGVFGLVVSVPEGLREQWEPHDHASFALRANARPRRLAKELRLVFRVSPDEPTVALFATRRTSSAHVDEAEFAQLVTAFFEDYLPERLPQRRGRLAPVNGVATPVPLDLRRRPLALRISAALLLTLALSSWLVPIELPWLVVGWIWWGAAIAVPMLMSRDLKRSLTSVAGVASTFLGLMVCFGLLYGVIYHAGTDISLPWVASGSSPRLGEMFMLSLGLAVSAGTTDVALEGLARFVAFVEVLLFFGTVAAVIGALGRRWLFDREIHITGETPITGLEDDRA